MTITVTVDKPGVYDMPADVYHADPVPGGSLSSSGARKLLPPSCPARFAYDRANPPTPTRAYDLGHAAHLHVLGAGPPLAIVDADSYRTKAAQQARDEAHAGGAVPLLTAEWSQVQAMAQAIRQHPIAAELFDPDRMTAEQALFWRDDPTGIWRRAQVDALSTPDVDGPVVLVDYKSCRSADLGHISKALYDYGYAMQAAWYLDGAATLGLAGRDARFLFVFQEKDPPHLVAVIEPDPTALAVGARLGRQAIETYRDCTAADVWPGHVAPTEIPLVALPPWIERQHTHDEEWM